MDSSADFIMLETIHGGKLPIVCGFEYMAKRKNDSHTVYLCNENKKGCRSRIKISNSKPYQLLPHKTRPHNHLPLTVGQVEAKIARQKMTREIKQHVHKPSQLISNEFSRLSPNAQPHIASKETIKRQLRRAASTEFPANPKTLQELVLAGEWRETIDGEQWLIYESPQEDKERMLVFSTEEGLKRLSEAETFLMDGMFSVPPLFKQLYTIHVPSEGSTMPVVYALLPRKNEPTYCKLFQVINMACEELQIPTPDPDNIIIDFETGVKNVIDQEYPSSNMRGCFFHLHQSMQRWLRAKKIIKCYRDDHFFLIYNMLKSLAFLPVEDVVHVFHEVQAACRTWEEKAFAKYFGETYVTKYGRNGRLRAALFPPHTWNLHHAILEGQPLTNNSTEAWHRKLQTIMNTDSPSIFQFILALKKENQANEVELVQREVGTVEPVHNASSRERAAKIVKVLENYGIRGVKSIDLLYKLAYC